jgi:DNA-binding MarR family transcriptional regulator
MVFERKLYFMSIKAEKQTYKKEFFQAVLGDIPGVIEVREFSRDSRVNRIWFKDVDDLLEYVPPEDKDIYFGVSRRRSTASGKTRNLGRAAALWADFDDTNLKEVKDKIRNSKIPKPSAYIHSGHGIHTYWFLDEAVRAEKITPFLKYISEAVGADSRAAEPARVMRVPCTFNNKFDPILCEITELNEYTRYSLENLKKRFNLEMTRENDNRETRIKGVKVPNSDRPCIQSILKGADRGERNWAQGRLTKWLQMKGYSKQRALDIVLAWNHLNNPPEEIAKIKNDFYSYWKEDYKLLGCSIPDPDLQAMLSKHCNRYECPIKGSLDSLEIENYIKINNRIFNEYKEITGYELIVYAVLLAEKDGLNTTQIKKELTHKSKKCMSRQRLSSAVKKLKKMNLITTRKRKGFATFCRVKEQGTFGTGYTLVNNGVINGAIYQAIRPSELKVYILLLKYAFNKGSAFPSTLTLSEKLGIKRQTVSDHIKALEKARYLKRRYDYNDQGVESLTCILLV